MMGRNCAFAIVLAAQESITYYELTFQMEIDHFKHQM